MRKKARYKQGVVLVLWLLFALAAGVVCAMRSLKAVDLHVYHAAARSFFLQSGLMYPSQSLRGVMLRYLTAMDCSGLPDQNYPHVNFVSLNSWEARQFWLVMAVLLGLFALFQVYRSADDSGAYSLFFCFLLINDESKQSIKSPYA